MYKVEEEEYNLSAKREFYAWAEAKLGVPLDGAPSWAGDTYQPTNQPTLPHTKINHLNQKIIIKWKEKERYLVTYHI